MIISDTCSSNFEILGVGLVPKSARGIVCKYDPIENGKIHYDVWGVAHSTAREAFNMFAFTLTCEDVWPPGFAGLYKGQRVTVHGSNDWIQPSNIPQFRPSADGIMTYYDANLQPVEKGNGDVWLRYRPRHECLIADFNFKSDEWGGTCSWMIGFKETR